MKYIIDKQFQDTIYKDTFYSYCEGAYNNKVFNTREEAEAYASEFSFMLESNEQFEVIEIEDDQA